MKHTTVGIQPKTLKKLQRHCQRYGLRVGYFADEAIDRMIDADRQAREKIVMPTNNLVHPYVSGSKNPYSDPSFA